MSSIGFTGTHHGMSRLQKKFVRVILAHYFTILPPTFAVFRHGDCIGADEEAHDIATELGYRTIIHPPDLDKRRAFCEGDVIEKPFPYLVRDKHIVERSSFMIGTPAEEYEQLRSGTWATIRHARRINRLVYIVWPEGKISLS